MGNFGELAERGARSPFSRIVICEHQTQEIINSYRPDLAFDSFAHVDLDQIAALGIRHVLLDVDGTVIPYGAHLFQPTEETGKKLEELYQDERFPSVSLATENGRQESSLRGALRLPETSRIFQPFVAGTLGMRYKDSDSFWKRILFGLDCLNKPEQVLIIGDTPQADIEAPRSHGLKTVLVGRLVEKFSIQLGERT